jgi:signal peptidase II
MPSGPMPAADRRPSPRRWARPIRRRLALAIRAGIETARHMPPSRYLLFFALAVLGCALDLATKSWMFRRLGVFSRDVWWVWPDVFGFQTSLNEGALFGIGQGMAPLFALLSIVAVAGIFCWLFLAGAARSWFLTVALGCIAAGVLGNLYDRLGLHGLRWPPGHPVRAPGEPIHAVRDWILVMIGRWPWPNFNLADSLLVCGAVLLTWYALRAEIREKRGA